jgi:FMN phosphatase YigB (HAD superfamily)
MTPPRPQGILFDLGNTLLGESPSQPAAGVARLLELADRPAGCDPEQVQRLAANLYAEVRSHLRAGPLEFRFRSFLRLVCDRFGITSGLAPAELELEFWKAVCCMKAEDGIGPVLEALAARGVALGVVSNAIFSGEVLRWELARNGLAERFRFVMSSADYGLQKPHPLVFATAVAKLGLRPEEVWFVGDHLHK